MQGFYTCMVGLSWLSISLDREYLDVNHPLIPPPYRLDVIDKTIERLQFLDHRNERTFPDEEFVSLTNEELDIVYWQLRKQNHCHW